MQHNWSRHVRLIISGIIGATLIGLYLGYPVYGFTLAVAVYLWWTLKQIRRLYLWLGNPNASEQAPQSVGLWGDIFDYLHKLHQTHLRTRIGFAPRSIGFRNPPTPCATAW